MTHLKYLQSLTVLDCLFSPRTVVKAVREVLIDLRCREEDLTALRAADKELVSRLQAVYIPDNTTLLTKRHAARITRGGST